MFLLRFHTNQTAPEKPGPEDLAEGLAALGVRNCAVTDPDTVAGVVASASAFREHGVRLIAGMEADYLGEGDRLLFLVRSRQGFQWLNEMAGRVGGDPEGKRPRRPTPPEAESLWVVCNLPGSHLRSLIREGREREAVGLIRRYLEHFGRETLRAALPPASTPRDLDLQSRNLAPLGRERVSFVTLGCREETGEPLDAEELAAAYARVPIAVAEAERVMEGCGFLWEMPPDSMPETHPGRGFRPESFLWERCQRRLQELSLRRNRVIEQRLYDEFHSWRTHGLLDAVAAVVQFITRTSLGVPIVRVGNPWLSSSFAAYLLGIHPVDIRALEIEAVPIEETEGAGVDINLFVGREDVQSAVRALQEIFGSENVAVRRRKAAERTSPIGEKSLFENEDTAPIDEKRDLPITEILVCRHRWSETLPFVLSEEGFLETDLPPKILKGMPLFRFHIRLNRLLTLIAEAARVAALRGKHIERSIPGREAFRGLSGSDGGRGILTLAIPGLSSQSNYLCLRRTAREQGLPPAGLEGFHAAVDRTARSLGAELHSIENRLQKMAFAEMLLTLSWIAETNPGLYYSALLSSEEMDAEGLRLAVAEAAARGVHVQPPDINLSDPKSTVTQEGIRLGLQCIRGIGPAISGEIVERRGKEDYRSIQDLCRRTNRRLLKRAVVEQLSAIGALDGVHPDRDEHPFYIERIFEEGPLRKESRSNQGLLFDVKEGRPAKKKRKESVSSIDLIPKPLEAFLGFLARLGFEKVADLSHGKERTVVTVGWFPEIFEGDGEGGRVGFLTDGGGTIPVALADGLELPAPGTACFVRGAVGTSRKRFSLSGLLRGRKTPEPADVPEWLSDLSILRAADWQYVREAETEVRTAAEMSARFGEIPKESWAGIKDAAGALSAVDKDLLNPCLVEGGGFDSRFVKRFRKLRFLPISLVVRWLESIPGIAEVRVIRKDEAPAEGMVPPSSVVETGKPADLKA